MATVLIVDDDPLVLELLKDFFSTLGHAALTASDGYSAMEVYRKNKTDLLILDFQMPAASGADVLARIRATVSGAVVPVIFVTATPLNEVKTRAADRLARFISKPIDLALLRSMVKPLLGNGASPAHKPADESEEGSKTVLDLDAS